MQFGLLSIEVDGTLHNPYVLAGFIMWTVLLCILSLWFLRFLYRRDMGSPKRLFLLASFLLSSYFVGFVACRLFSTFLYIVSSFEFMSVGYWGKAPFWAPSTTAAAISLTALIIRRRIHETRGDGEQPAATQKATRGG